MHNLPFIGLLLAGLILVTFCAWRNWDFLKDFLTIGEDQWTWTTKTGDIYEDAEIAQIEVDEILLQHRLGAARVPIASLSTDTRRLLLCSPQWNQHVSSAPAQGKITTFAVKPAVEQVHAPHAA